MFIQIFLKGEMVMSEILLSEVKSGQIQCLSELDSVGKSGNAGEGHDEAAVFYPLSPIQMTLFYSFRPEIDIA
jgi:hypothetical protein